MRPGQSHWTGSGVISAAQREMRAELSELREGKKGPAPLSAVLMVSRAQTLIYDDGMQASDQGQRDRRRRACLFSDTADHPL